MKRKLFLLAFTLASAMAMLSVPSGSVSASECGEDGVTLCSYVVNCRFFRWFCAKPSDFKYYNDLL